MVHPERRPGPRHHASTSVPGLLPPSTTSPCSLQPSAGVGVPHSLQGLTRRPPPDRRPVPSAGRRPCLSAEPLALTSPLLETGPLCLVSQLRRPRRPAPADRAGKSIPRRSSGQARGCLIILCFCRMKAIGGLTSWAGGKERIQFICMQSSLKI